LVHTCDCIDDFWMHGSVIIGGQILLTKHLTNLATTIG
jgi:hypothetical protein